MKKEKKKGPDFSDCTQFKPIVYPLNKPVEPFQEYRPHDSKLKLDKRQFSTKETLQRNQSAQS